MLIGTYGYQRNHLRVVTGHIGCDISQDAVRRHDVQLSAIGK